MQETTGASLDDSSPSLEGRIKIKDLDLSPRVQHCCEANNIQTLEDLINYPETDLMRLPNFGRKSLNEVKDFISQRGLDFQQNAPLEVSPVLDPLSKIDLLRPLRDFNLSVRATNCLLPNFNLVGDVVQKTPSELLKLPSFGRGTLKEIQEMLAQMGLALGSDVVNWDEENIRTLTALHKDQLATLALESVQRTFRDAQEKHPSVEAEMEGLIATLGLKGQRNEAIYRNFYGLDGSGRKTLEAIGQQAGTTRERIRQIVAKASKKRRIPFSAFPVTQQALNSIRNAVPVRKKELQQLLLKEGHTIAEFDISGFLSIQEIFGIEPDWHIYKINGVEYILYDEDLPILKAMFSYSRKLVSRDGYACLEDVKQFLVAEYDLGNRVDKILQAMSFMPDLVWLSESANSCFVIPWKRNRLLNTIKKILCVSPSIDLSTLRAGIRRNRRIQRPPNKDILLQWCKAVPDLQFSGGVLHSSTALEPEAVLGDTELSFLKLFNTHNNLMTYPELKDACREIGMNSHTFEIYLHGSPIIINFGKFVYGLRGANIDPELIELKQREMKSLSSVTRELDTGWIGINKIWVTQIISLGVLRTGIFGLPIGIAEFLEGEFQLVSLSGETMGYIKGNELNQFWSVKKALAARGADIDDIMLLVFDLEKYVVAIEVGDANEIQDAKDICESGLLLGDDDAEDDVDTGENEIEATPA